MVRNDDLLLMMLAAMDATGLLEEERFAGPENMWTNRMALANVLEPIFLSRTSDEWLAKFDEFQVPVSRVAIIEEIADDPQIRVNNMIVTSTDPGIQTPHIIRHPVQVSSLSQVPLTRAPAVGEDSEQILIELGYGEAAIRELREAGVI